MANSRKRERELSLSLSPLQIFKPIYELAAKKDETAIKGLLWPAANHNNILLRSALNNSQKLHTVFYNHSLINETIVLAWAVQIAKYENNLEVANWLMQTFSLTENDFLATTTANSSDRDIQIVHQLMNGLPVTLNETECAVHSEAVIVGILLSGALIMPDYQLVAERVGFAKQYPILKQIHLMLHPNQIPDAPHSILEFMKGFSFIHQKITYFCLTHGLLDEYRGICHGLALMTTQAYLCDDEQTLKHRLTMHCMYTTSQLQEMLTSSDTDTRSAALELQIFVENAALLQRPSRWPQLFSQTKPITQNKIKHVLPLVASKKMEELKGIYELARYSGVYSELEFSEYLTALADFFKIHYPQFQGRFSLITADTSHTVAIIYDAKLGRYIYTNAGDIYENFTSTPALTTAVKAAFKANNVLILCTTLLCLNKDALLLADAMKKFFMSEIFERIHQVTEARRLAVDASGVSLLQLATAHEDEKTVAYLLKHGVRTQLSHGGFSPLRFAVTFANPRITSLLLEDGADMTLEDADGITPMGLALQEGCEEVVTVMRNYGAKKLLKF